MLFYWIYFSCFKWTIIEKLTCHLVTLVTTYFKCVKCLNCCLKDPKIIDIFRDKKHESLGSGCGEVGRAIAFDTRNPLFHSRHRQFHLLLTALKGKEAGNGPIFCL